MQGCDIDHDTIHPPHSGWYCQENSKQTLVQSAANVGCPPFATNAALFNKANNGLEAVVGVMCLGACEPHISTAGKRWVLFLKHVV